MEKPRSSGINPFYLLSADNPFLPSPYQSKSGNIKNENRLRVPKMQQFDVDTGPWPSKKKCPDSSEVPKSQGFGSKIRNNTKILKDSQGEELSRSCFSLGTPAREETTIAPASKKASENEESSTAETKAPNLPPQDSDRCFTFISIRDKASPSKTAKTRTLPASSCGTASKKERPDRESRSAAPIKSRSNTFVISETKSPLAAKVKENIKFRVGLPITKEMMVSLVI